MVTRAAIVAFVAGSIAVVPAAAGVMAARPASTPKYLVAFASEPSSGWTTRNFNPFSASPNDFTVGGIYEPLMDVTLAGGGHTYPWLATSFKWGKGNRSLTATLRKGVKWSDGKPFSSADVVFTFDYSKSHNVDQTGLVSSGQITSVTAKGNYKVVFTFKTPNTTVLKTLLGATIIPEHIWKNVSDPATYTNPNPVGTGPFTQVANFSTEEYTLGRNPYYWQKLHYAGIEVPAFSSNDSALAAMVKGEVDWAPIAIPNAQKAYVDANPKYFHYYFSSAQTPLDLMFNDQQYPYNLTALRQAISMSINRKELSVIAETGYEKPADALGLSTLYPSWLDPSIKALDKKLSTYNPKAALTLLRANHFSYKGGQLYDPKGNKVQMGITCPAGWSDWQTQLQILQSNLKNIGIHVQISFIDQNTWFANRSSRTMGGKYYGLFGTMNAGQTPYQFFWSFMSQESYWPVNGKSILGVSWNVEGWYNNKATHLLDQFRQTSGSKLQHTIVDQLEKIDLQKMPEITTVYQAAWYEYNTEHFTGFPTATKYYAYGPAYDGDAAKILTSLRPR